MVRIVVFVALAYALAWLVALPLWLGDGLDEPYFGLVTAAMMATPTIAAVVTWFAFSARGGLPDDATGTETATAPTTPTFVRSTGMWPLGSMRRLAPALAASWLVPVVLVLITIAVSLAVGSATLREGSMADAIADLMRGQGLSEDDIAAQAEVFQHVPMGAFAALLVAQALFGAFLNVIPAAGEEIGWRGFLHPLLRDRLGWAGAVAVGGVIWGAWHAPLLLLGYNYERRDVLGVLAMCVFCVLVGALLVVLRDATGSVWPAALAHGSLNASAGIAVGLTDSTSAFHGSLILGWLGWMVLAVAVALVLFVRRPRRPRPTNPQQPPVPNT